MVSVQSGIRAFGVDVQKSDVSSLMEIVTLFVHDVHLRTIKQAR